MTIFVADSASIGLVSQAMHARMLAAVFLVAVVAGTSTAADRFVSTQGSDASSNDCLTSSAPCRTIGYALGQASSGDVVKVTTGKYDESPVIGASTVVALSGSWTADFGSRDAASRGSKLLGRLLLFAGSGETIDVTVDGFLLTRDAGVSAVSSGNGSLTVRLVSTDINFNRFSPGIIADASETSTLDIETTGSSVSLNRVMAMEGAIYLESDDSAVLSLAMTDSVVERNFTSAYRTAGIRAYGGGTFDILLTRTRVERNRGPGLQSQNYAGSASLSLIESSVSRNRDGGLSSIGANVNITNSIIARNRSAGLFMRSSTLQVVNSTIRGNRRPCGTNPSCAAGLWVDTLPATVDLRNAIVWGNIASGGADDVAIATGATVDVDHSDIGELTGAYNDLGGNIDADPLLVSRRDAHLTASSPAIDAGTCTGAPATDVDGDARPTGGGCDMGADEYVP
jgi:hypothetical protein